MVERTVVWAIAVLTLVAVTGTAWLVLGPEPAERRPLVLRADAGWRAHPTVRLVYRDRSGRPVVALRRLATYGEGACASDPGVPLALVGSPAPSTGPHRRLARAWVEALRHGQDGTDDHLLAWRWTRRTPQGWRTDAVVEPTGDHSCLAPRVHLTLVTPARGAPVVLVRDVGVPGALSPERAAQSLRSRT